MLEESRGHIKYHLLLLNTTSTDAQYASNEVEITRVGCGWLLVAYLYQY